MITNMPTDPFYRTSKSSLVLSATVVQAAKIKTLIERPEDDRRVPHRHPLQRLWRLYQEQTHSYKIFQKYTCVQK